MADPTSPQDLVVDGIRSVESLTHAIRALEKSHDQLRDSLAAHDGAMRADTAKILNRLAMIEKQVKRCEDRADMAVVQEREERGRAMGLLESVVRSPEFRMLITAGVLAIAAYLGVQGQVAGMIPASGGAP